MMSRVAACVSLKDIHNETLQVEQQLRDLCSERSWWGDALSELASNHQFMDALDGSIARGEAAYNRLKSFHDFTGLLYVLGTEFGELCAARSKALKGILELDRQPSSAEVLESSDCHRCREYFQKIGPLCKHCQLYDRTIRDYKAKHITATRRQTTRAVAVTTKKSDKAAIVQQLGGHEDLFLPDEELEVRKFDEGVIDGPFIMVMKLVKSFVGKYHLKEYEELSKLEVAWLDLVCKEQRAMTDLWDKYSDVLKAHDELEQCKLRVELAQEGIPGASEQFYPHELSATLRAACLSTAQAYNQILEAKASMGFYKTQTRIQAVQPTAARQKQTLPHCSKSVEEDDKPLQEVETCSICMEALFPFNTTDPSNKEQAVILPCAHRFHSSCALNWVRPYRRCPLCKHAVKVEDLLPVTSQQPLAHKAGCQSIAVSVDGDAADANSAELQRQLEQQTSEHFPVMLRAVKGHWGAKVDAIVADMLLLQRQTAQADEKVIIFSQWLEVSAH